MRELILDHGAEFGAHRVHEDGKKGIVNSRNNLNNMT
jgi:hypothetical protein